MRALSLGTLLIAVIAASALLDPDNGFAIWRELRSDLETSSTRVDRLIIENEALRGEIAILESEPAALDRAIREELDLALPGEVVVRFEPASAQRGRVPGQDSSRAWNSGPAAVSAAGPGWESATPASSERAEPGAGAAAPGASGDEASAQGEEDLAEGDFQDGEALAPLAGGSSVGADAIEGGDSR